MSFDARCERRDDQLASCREYVTRTILMRPTVDNSPKHARRRHSQPWIHRLALEREHSECALVHPPERFAAHESFEALDTQCKLPNREGTFCS